MLITSGITITIQGPNLNYYRKIGYNIKKGDIINIPIEHLPKGSHKKVLISCDICNTQKESFYFAYNKYLSKSSNNKYYCNKCNDINRKKTLMKKYGVDALMNYHDTKDVVVSGTK